MITAISTTPLTPLAKAAKSLEAVFLRQMIASMRAPALADDPFGSSSATQFRDMSDAKLADSMAGGFGIADMVEKQMKGRVA
ncbi:MAG: flagellar biosynthesis protein FlgI [Sphingomonadales bacterium]|nr:flagellar biosynthesis protein FlgI [Sphingomonadales bacterium]